MKKTLVRPFLPVLLAVAALCAGGCRVRDVRTAELRVPDVSNEARLRVAESALAKLPRSRLKNDRGDEDCLKVLSMDFKTGVMTVRYDSMKVGTKNLEAALADAGFETPTFPANEEARRRLPPANP